MISIRLLGVIDVRDAEGREIGAVLSQPKRLALLAYLATPCPGGHHRRDTLLGLFWPDLDSDHARGALNKAVHFLREQLGADAIVSRSTEELALDTARIWTDVGAFEAAVAAERYDEALRLYQGDLLPAVYFSDSAPFEHWLEETRTRFRLRAIRASRLEAERHEAARNYTRAIDVARRGAELAQDDERTLRRLLALLARLGDRAGALSMYDRFARRLDEDLGATPSPETVALIEEIRSSRSPTPAPSPSPSPSDRATAPSSLDLALGDRYQVVREIGSGSSARVYLAEDRKLKRQVAIKVLRPTLAGMGQAAKFEAEILVAARLNHPHLVPLLDAGEATGLLYYVMPHVAGETLRERLDRTGQLSIAEALSIAREVADALSYAHGRGFVHRDIKPENILLADGHALVTDFGIARTLTTTPGPGEGGSGSGTPMYASPEQVDGTSPADGRADIYSLGCVLYELLAGRPPFQAETVTALLGHHRDTLPPPLIAFRPEIPTTVASLVGKALAKRPEDRPADATAFLADLREVSDTGARPSIGKKGRRIAAGLAAALLSAVGWWQFAARPLDPANRPELLLASVDAGTDSTTARAIESALSADLLGSTAYRLVSPQRISAAQRRMGRAPNAFLDDSAARDLAEREGIPLIAVVSANPLVGKFVVTVKVVTPEDAVVGAARALADSLPVITIALDTISKWIRRYAGESRASVASRPSLQQVTTSSLPALRLYSRALIRGPSDAAARAPIPLLEEAVRLDTTFAMAYRRLAIEHWLNRRFAEGRKYFRLADRYRARLSQVERDLVDADLALQFRFDTLGRRQALDRVLAADPENWVALLARGTYELQFQRPAEAVPYVTRALQIDSLRSPAWDLQFSVRFYLGDTAGAEAAAQRKLTLDRDPLNLPSYFSLLAWRTGDLTTYRKRIDSILAAVPPRASVEVDEAGRIGAVLPFLAGRLGEGQQLWDAHAETLEPERAAQFRASTPFRRAQCDAVLQADPEATTRYLSRAESTFALSTLPPDERAGTVMYLAGAWAFAGRPDRARNLLARWWPKTTELAPFVIATRWMMEAHILEAEGNDDGVLALGRAHLRSPITVQLALPMSWAFQRKGEIDSAIAYGELYATRFTYPFLTADWSCAEQMLHHRLGLLYLSRREHAKAREHFQRIVGLWGDPDPALRPFVDQARDWIAYIDRTTTPLD